MDASTLIMVALAAAGTVVAYLRDPGLPLLGLKAGLHLFWFILPRLLAALILTGMLQVLISPEMVGRWLGREAGLRGIVFGFLAGILTPGGPMVSVPIMAVFYQSGAALSSLVAYMTSWSLFGFQRVVAWELPFMGGRFVLARILPTLAVPILAGLLVKLVYHE